MSVVINDFEVVPESSDDGTAADEEQESAAPEASSLRPVDVTEIVDRMERRRRRLRAH
jgi:hypothetical protein